MLTELPLSFRTFSVRVRDYPDVIKYREQVVRQATDAGLDIARLEAYRLAIQIGFYTDYPQETR